MTPTIKAILARFNGDSWEAVKYCCRVARENRENPHVVCEYEALAVEIRLLSTPSARGVYV